MATPIVVMNKHGVGMLMKSTDMRRYLMRAAQPALERAKAAAPVDSGAYRDGLHLELEETPERWVVHLAGSTDHDVYVEAMTGNLQRALAAVRLG